MAFMGLPSENQVYYQLKKAQNGICDRHPEAAYKVANIEFYHHYRTANHHDY